MRSKNGKVSSQCTALSRCGLTFSVRSLLSLDPNHPKLCLSHKQTIQLQKVTAGAQHRTTAPEGGGDRTKTSLQKMYKDLCHGIEIFRGEKSESFFEFCPCSLTVHFQVTIELQVGFPVFLPLVFILDFFCEIDCEQVRTPYQATGTHHQHLRGTRQ